MKTPMLIFATLGVLLLIGCNNQSVTTDTQAPAIAELVAPITLAEAEGLHAHAHAVRIRLDREGES